ncbi:thiamine-phosphate kinase [Quadrisphaera granulorum]|uniref:Thiamine-monophosphate kinase n=1 Tax=Quadrisphaera granulorum TaxID=317664 RepID=A0A316AGH2_9ACTN|nr:thiamine-phosphate kinase [Quadrisphaera granulorum]SZE95002.1 thiamine-phosphate kinase [Quadrisphaera granulorum]
MGKLVTVGEAGEAVVLERLLAALAVPASVSGVEAPLLGPGDDAAVVVAPDARVVATTDLLVEGRDFRTDWSSGADVGAKAVAQNLADVAAMGAVPTGLLLTVGAPSDTPLAWLEDLGRGVAAACSVWSTSVIGGDLSGASELLVSITALGDLQGRAPVCRSGARPGDVLALAGSVGRSAAGLALLLAGGPELAEEVAPELLAAHRRPVPPVGAGPAAAAAGATAMLDVSDGLGVDGARLAAASRVHLDVDADWEDQHVLDLLVAARRLGGDDDPWGYGLVRSWVRGGGEDHALLATFPAGVAARGLPEPFVRIGEVLPVRSGWPAVTVNGDDEVVGGWDVYA